MATINDLKTKVSLHESQYSTGGCIAIQVELWLGEEKVATSVIASSSWVGTKGWKQLRSLFSDFNSGKLSWEKFREDLDNIVN